MLVTKSVILVQFSLSADGKVANESKLKLGASSQSFGREMHKKTPFPPCEVNAVHLGRLGSGEGQSQLGITPSMEKRLCAW